MSVINVDSKYQNIRIAQDLYAQGEYILWLDGAWQFNSKIEYLYHESLITLPMATAPSIGRVLICGGGDGLAVRDALRFKDMHSIVLAEIDPMMINIFQNQFAFLNNNSLWDTERLKINIGDALAYADGLPDN